MKKYKYQKTWIDPVTGKRVVVRADDEEELWRKYFVRRYNETFTAPPAPTNYTVRSWGEEAVKLYKSNLSDRTLTGYLSTMRANIFNVIGDMDLADVTPQILQQALNEQRGYSVRQISLVYQIMQFLFRTAYREKIIPVDVSANLVKPHGKKKHTRRALTDNERSAFLSVIAGLTRDHPLFLFTIMYYTGLRPSEVFTLKGSDVMKIDGKDVLRVRGEKTKSASRYVPLPYPLNELMSGVPANQLIVAKNEHMFDKNDYDNAGRMLRRRLKKKGIVSDFCPYMLRHDYCTRLKKKGVPLRDAQYLMGHSKISITAEIYTHVTAEEVLVNF